MARCKKVRFAFAALLGLTGALAWGQPGHYEESWGPPIGGALPAMAMPDHRGELRDLARFSGERGLLLLIARSADW